MTAFFCSPARVACAAALASLPLAATAQEFRGVWCSRFQWASTNRTTAQTNITNVLNNMQTGRFNTIFFQIRGQGETFYNSPDEPWSANISSNNTDPGWDPLTYAVSAAHTRGLKLHAYFNTHTIWSGATNSPPSTMPEHMYWQHANPSDPARRDWLLYNSNGSPTSYQTGTDEYLWMNPGVPAADAFVRKQAMYVLSNYDIDGLHFDRVRMPSPGYGKNPIAVTRWDNPNTTTANDGQGNPQRLSWDAFMRDSITRHLINIAGQGWSIKRTIPMSSAPLGLWDYSAYSSLGGYSSGMYYGYTRGQDAKAWMQMGAQDFIVPQIYWANGGTKPDFNEVYNDWLTAANTHGRYLVGGANNSEGQTEVESNARYVRTAGGNGKGLNLWQSANTAYSTWSASGHPYAGTTPATPTFPWRSTEGVIVGKVFTNSTLSTPVTDAWITRNGSTWTALSSGDGLFAFLRVPPGTYTLSFSHPTYGTGTLANVSVTAGNATTVNLSFSGGGGTPGEIIVDNPAATVSGTWTSATSATDKYGSDYRYKGPGTGTAYLQYTPSITTAGTYDVYEWHSQGSNRTTGAPHQVTHSGGTTTVNVNQQVGGGAWNKIGTWNFSAGTSGRVRITDGFSGTNIVAIADAVKFVPVPAAEIVVDNSNSGFTATTSWNTGTSATDKYGADYRFRDTAVGATGNARWSFSIPATRSYTAYAWWAQGSNRSSAAPYRVTHSGGTTTVNRNQQANGGSWQSLGTYTFNSGTSGNIELSSSATAGFVVVADAVRLVPN